MLGVRLTTCNDVCYVESGYTSLKSIVKSRQRVFFSKMFNERYHIQDDPLGFVLRLVLNNNYSTKNYISNFINENPVNDCQQELETIKYNLRQSDSSRRMVYCNVINTNLSRHNIYTNKHNLNEVHRVFFTRFRVSSHMLAVETGRWNRRGRGRLPMEERLCSCGLIQSEEHVVSDCPISQNLRNKYGFASINDLMKGNIPDEIACKIVYEI